MHQNITYSGWGRGSYKESYSDPSGTSASDQISFVSVTGSEVKPVSASYCSMLNRSSRTCHVSTQHRKTKIKYMDS